MITPKRITVQTDAARLSGCLPSAFTLADNTWISSSTLRPARQKEGKRTCDLTIYDANTVVATTIVFSRAYPLRHGCGACGEIKDNSERVGMIQTISYHKNISIESQKHKMTMTVFTDNNYSLGEKDNRHKKRSSIRRPCG